MSEKTKTFFKFFVSLAILCVAFILELCLGAEKISLRALFGAANNFETIILRNLRLPRATLVLIAGILLGGSGAIFQLFFRNPLAEPGILGITSGATLGAVFATAFIPSGIALFSKSFFNYLSPVNFFAFCGALFAGILITFFSFSQKSQNSSIIILLCGTALGTLFSTISSLILLVKSDTLRTVYSWILGSFNGRGRNELLFILLPSVISIFLMILISKPLDLLTCGEKTASALGVNVPRLRILVLICGALSASCVVCAGGTIGFLGLIAPHVSRKIAGVKSAKLIPFSSIISGIILLLSDVLCRIIIRPGELPTGVIMPILGAPFFIALCFENKTR